MSCLQHLNFHCSCCCCCWCCYWYWCWVCRAQKYSAQIIYQTRRRKSNRKRDTMGEQWANNGRTMSNTDCHKWWWIRVDAIRLSELAPNVFRAPIWFLILIVLLASHHIAFTFRMTKVTNTESSQMSNRRLQRLVAHAWFTQSFIHAFTLWRRWWCVCTHAAAPFDIHISGGCARVHFNDAVCYRRLMIVLLLQIEMMRNRGAFTTALRVDVYLNIAKTTWQNQIKSLFN